MSAVYLRDVDGPKTFVIAHGTEQLLFRIANERKLYIFHDVSSKAVQWMLLPPGVAQRLIQANPKVVGLTLKPFDFLEEETVPCTCPSYRERLMAQVNACLQ